jgi:hypothetical protein
VGTTPSCIDPTTNNAFCGADSNCSVSSYVNCGSIPGSSCSQQAGQAKPMCNCPAGQLNCGGACVDPTTNPNFCGATGNCTNTGAGNSTGNVCSANSLTTCGLKPGSNGVYYCETKCTSASDPGTGQLACGINQPGAYCANYQTDNSNCGNCGVSCGSPAVTLTTCGPDSGVTPPAPGDLPFGCNSICPAGQNACILGTSYCTNLSTDPNNCGDGGANIDGSTNGCGNKCGTGLVCTSGTCTSTCGSPETQCGADAGGACANLNNDPNNCGTCGTACGTGLACLQNPGGSAAPAQCCTTNYNTVCNNTAAPPVPTCVDTTTDNTNCGSCGQVCPLYHAHASTPTTCVNSTPPSCNVHSDGLNSGWDDDTAPSTFSAAEALTACQTWEKANGLSNGCIAAQTVCESGYSGAYDNNFIWWYTDPDGGAGQTIAGEVTVYTCSTLPPTGIPVVSHWY